MDGVGGGRRRVAAKSSAEDQALDQIAKEVSKLYHFVKLILRCTSLFNIIKVLFLYYILFFYYWHVILLWTIFTALYSLHSL